MNEDKPGVQVEAVERHGGGIRVQWSKSTTVRMGLGG